MPARTGSLATCRCHPCIGHLLAENLDDDHTQSPQTHLPIVAFGAMPATGEGAQIEDAVNTATTIDAAIAVASGFLQTTILNHDERASGLVRLRNASLNLTTYRDQSAPAIGAVLGRAIGEERAQLGGESRQLAINQLQSALETGSVGSSFSLGEPHELRRPARARQHRLVPNRDRRRQPAPLPQIRGNDRAQSIRQHRDRGRLPSRERGLPAALGGALAAG